MNWKSIYFVKFIYLSVVQKLLGANIAMPWASAYTCYIISSKYIWY